MISRSDLRELSSLASRTRTCRGPELGGFTDCPDPEVPNSRDIDIRNDRDARSATVTAAATAESSGGKYRLLLEGAKYADEHGFSAVWTPERHFHPFGGLYPNAALTGAAVAAVTKRIGIRAGSVVLPEGPASSLALSGDGSALALGSGSESIRLLDTGTGSLRAAAGRPIASSLMPQKNAMPGSAGVARDSAPRAAAASR